MRERIKSIKEDYNYVKQHKILNSLLGCLVLLISIGFMFLTVATVLTKIVPSGSWINLVSGDSMDPTLHNHQFMFSMEKEIEQGDIVVSHFPQAVIDADMKNESTTIIKRVIGLPGDIVDIEKDGTVLVNHSVLDEDYLTPEHKVETYIEGKNYHVELGVNEYFIMGDNRGNSYDSRYFGPVKGTDILYVQSTKITSMGIQKTIYVVLYIILIAFMYNVIDFIVMEIAYKILISKEGKVK